MSPWRWLLSLTALLLIARANDEAVTAEIKKLADEADGVSMSERLLKGYRKQFSLKRQAQTTAAENIFQKPRFEQRFQMVKLLLDEIFKQLRKSQTVLANVTWQELPTIPIDNEPVLLALIQVWQNTAFFGDLVLRMPDQVWLAVASLLLLVAHVVL
jgi:hypothetical protein